MIFGLRGEIGSTEFEHECNDTQQFAQPEMRAEGQITVNIGGMREGGGEDYPARLRGKFPWQIHYCYLWRQHLACSFFRYKKTHSRFPAPFVSLQ